MNEYKSSANTAAKGSGRTLRKLHSYTISHIAAAKLEALAVQAGINNSRMLEQLLMCDYGELFAMFEDRKSFADVVRASHLHPDIVRDAHAQWTAGYNPLLPPVTAAVYDRKERLLKTGAELRRREREATEDRRALEMASKERRTRWRTDAQRHRADTDVRIERTRAVATPSPPAKR
jgi:hypothetical protein